ncbi:hypothetical protein Avbf_13592 [Armadillidium vulgare]|nr:hypothetical protein Avbf_13592 [Armadillidium vulgare]
MAFFNASTSASLSSEGGLIENDFNKQDDSIRKKSRDPKSVLQRTFSTPSATSLRPSRSSTCPSRSNWSSRDANFSLRSLRSISSPSRMSFMPSKQNIQKFSSLIETASNSFDFKCKYQQPKLLSCQAVNNQYFSDQDLFDSNEGLQVPNPNNQISLLQNGANRVGRSISSPEGLQPVTLQHLPNSFPIYSPSSPGRFRFPPSAQTDSHAALAGRPSTSTNVSASSYLPSPTISYSGDLQNSSTDRSIQNVYSPPLPGTSGSLNSSIYSSRTSVRGVHEVESSTTSGTDIFSFQGHSHASFWQREASPGVSLRLQGGATEERPRLSQLALAHLTSRDLTSIHFQSPPPSYEKLCNPEALPTYQEAIEGERKGFKRFEDQRTVFTLPSVPDYNSSHTDPLLQR